MCLLCKYNIIIFLLHIDRGGSFMHYKAKISLRLLLLGRMSEILRVLILGAISLLPLGHFRLCYFRAAQKIRLYGLDLKIFLNRVS